MNRERFELAKKIEGESVETKEVDPIIMDYLATDRLTSKIGEPFRQVYKDIFKQHFEGLEKYQPIEKNCRLSIVLPAFREEDLIKETLQSLAEQQGVDFDKFEVVLLVNYPEGKEPYIENIFNKQGELIKPAHFDETEKIAREFAKNNPDLRLRIIEQSFPNEVAGVGIASKLGMDLALARQRFNPGIISYYGADTTFGENFAKGLIDSFADGQTEAVQGRISKVSYYKKVVEEVGGKQVEKTLTDLEIDKIVKLASKMRDYILLLQDFEEIHGTGATERAGISNLTAGKYAEIAGMNAQKIGEDWQMAEDIINNSQKREVKKVSPPGVEITIWGRISEPRTGDGSFTDLLWKSYQFLECSTEDKTEGPLVESPYMRFASFQLRVFPKEAQRLFNIGEQDKLVNICPAILMDKGLLNRGELVLLSEQPNYKSFLEQARVLFENKLGRNFYEVIENKLKEGFPPMPLYEAIELAKKIKEELEIDTL